MENKLISHHLVLVCAYVFNPGGNGWTTTKTIAVKMGIPERTVRHHLKRLDEVRRTLERKPGKLRMRLASVAAMFAL